MHVLRIALFALTHLKPDFALLLLTLGFLLIYLELNRPGWILPGAIGLLLALLSIASFFHLNIRVPAAFLVLIAFAVLASGLVRPIHTSIAAAVTLALIAGFAYMVKGPDESHVHLPTALACGLILGAGTSVLTAIARRARLNKRVRLT